MAEEYEESEVVFEENVEEERDLEWNWESRKKVEEYCNKAKRKKMSSSVPVSIPENVSRNAWLRCIDSGDEEAGDEMVPPHVMVGRRVAGNMMAFSVCTGNGRTLKGRDLSQVRNSILRMTGFLET